MANDIRSKVVLGIDVNEFRRGITQVDSSLKRLHGQFQNLGGVIGATFVVSKIQDFGREALQLGMQMEGVKAAFDKLNNESDLDTLRESVRGTISDLKLMQEANKAASVNIGMDTLATTMQYLQKYSRATGDSMEKLVGDATQELIRQTGLRLDQLGIDLLVVRDRMKITGDYTEAVLSVMRDNMKKLGDTTLTTADKVDQQKARIENLTASIGEGLLPAYAWFLDTVAGIMEKIMWLTNKVGSGMSDIADAAANVPIMLLGGADVSTGTSGNMSGEKAFLARQQMIGMAPPEIQFQPEVKQTAETLSILKERLEALSNAFDTVAIGTAQFYQLRTEIEELQQRIKDLTSGVVPQTEALKLQAKTTNDVYQAQEKSLKVMKQIPAVGNAYTDWVKDITDATEAWNAEIAIMNYMGQEFGSILSNSFNAALESGENFFTVMGDALKKYVQQLMAAIAATTVLSVISTAAGVGSFAEAFNTIGGGMGLPFGIGEKGNLTFRISGYDLVTGPDREAKRLLQLGAYGK